MNPDHYYNIRNFPKLYTEVKINFVKKGKRTLNNLQCIKLTRELLDNYKTEYKQLKHVRLGGDIVAFVWVEPSRHEQIACYLAVEKKEPDKVWIQALEVMPGYRNKGLGRQLTEFAIHNLKANYLSVRPTNKIAIKMYEHCGFSMFEQNENMIFMRKTR